MIAALCPYCRAPFEPADAEPFLCPACGTPHHEDCFQENGGCTVFGCQASPADEPKLSLDLAALASAPVAVNTAMAAPRTPPPPPLAVTPQPFVYHGNSTLFGVPPKAPVFRLDPEPAPFDAVPKNRMTFIVLGILLGPFGAHNFFAGYRRKAMTQLCITVLTLGLAIPMTWVWGVIDACTIDSDSSGVKFFS